MTPAEHAAQLRAFLDDMMQGIGPNTDDLHAAADFLDALEEA